jgi:hypothetical protein
MAELKSSKSKVLSTYLTHRRSENKAWTFENGEHGWSI